MKHLTYTAIVFILFTRCGYELPTQYARIDETVRNIVFVYDNNGLAEGAPGDNVGVDAFFAGDNISNANWSVSTGIVYGTILEKDSLIDSLNLVELMVPGSYRRSHGLTGDTVHFDIVIPENIIRKQFGGIASMSSLMPPGLDKNTTKALDSISPLEVIDILEMLCDNSGQFDPVAINSIVYSMFGDSTENAWRLLTFVLQALTVNMRFFVEVNGVHEVESVFSVRYNRKLKYLNRMITVNRNPGIYQVRINIIDQRKVRSGSEKGLDTTIVLSENQMNIIDIHEGCSYYLTVSIDGSIRDSGMEYNCNGQRGEEKYLSEWFYKNNSSIPGADKNKQFFIEKKIGSSQVRLFPPADTEMEEFCIWVVITDYFYGERLRPAGFATKAFFGRFRYSEEYKKKHR